MSQQNPARQGAKNILFFGLKEKDYIFLHFVSNFDFVRFLLAMLWPSVPLICWKIGCRDEAVHIFLKSVVIQCINPYLQHHHVYIYGDGIGPVQGLSGPTNLGMPRGVLTIPR